VGGPRFTDFTAKSRFELSDGDWVDFRAELSFSEQAAVEMGAMVSKLDQTTREMDVAIDWSELEVCRLAAWIADWSFTDADGLREPPTKASIRKLNQATAKELSAALDGHVSNVEGDGPKGSAAEAS
jgi:hypothetical protein